METTTIAAQEDTETTTTEPQAKKGQKPDLSTQTPGTFYSVSKEYFIEIIPAKIIKTKTVYMGIVFVKKLLRPMLYLHNPFV